MRSNSFCPVPFYTDVFGPFKRYTLIWCLKKFSCFFFCQPPRVIVFFLRPKIGPCPLFQDWWRFYHLGECTLLIYALLTNPINKFEYKWINPLTMLQRTRRIELIIAVKKRGLVDKCTQKSLHSNWPKLFSGR